MPRGLKLFIRDNHWHMRGTVRAAGKSFRVRESLGLPANRPREEAEALRIRRETELLHSAVYGAKPTVTWAQAALSYLEHRKPSVKDARYIAHITDHFRDTPLQQITTAGISGYVGRHHRNKKASTANRYLNSLSAVLHHAKRMGWLDTVPHIERPKDIGHERVDKWLTVEEAELLISCYAPHLQQLAIFLCCTGCRIGEAVALTWTQVSLAPAHERVVFLNTKNGDSRGVPLHPWAIAALASLPHHQGHVFLTNRGVPYTDRRGEYGGQIKTGHNAAKRRAAAKLEKVDPERAAYLLRWRVHDWRHHSASHHAMNGTPDRTMMELFGWKDPRMVKKYAHLSREHLRQAVDNLPFGTNLTREIRGGRERA